MSVEATYRGVLFRRGRRGGGRGSLRVCGPSCKKAQQAVERTLIEQAVRRVPAEGDGRSRTANIWMGRAVASARRSEGRALHAGAVHHDAVEATVGAGSSTSTSPACAPRWMCFISLTTVRGNPTLGEECVDIRHGHHRAAQPLGVARRLSSGGRHPHLAVPAARSPVRAHRRHLLAPRPHATPPPLITHAYTVSHARARTHTHTHQTITCTRMTTLRHSSNTKHTAVEDRASGATSAAALARSIEPNGKTHAG